VVVSPSFWKLEHVLFVEVYPSPERQGQIEYELLPVLVILQSNSSKLRFSWRAMKQVSVCQEILSASSLKIRNRGSAYLCRFGIAFTIIGFKIRYRPLLKYRGYLIYPVRNNAPLEFLTGFTSGAIFSIIFMIACGARFPSEQISSRKNLSLARR